MTRCALLASSSAPTAINSEPEPHGESGTVLGPEPRPGRTRSWLVIKLQSRSPSTTRAGLDRGGLHGLSRVGDPLDLLLEDGSGRPSHRAPAGHCKLLLSPRRLFYDLKAHRIEYWRWTRSARGRRGTASYSESRSRNDERHCTVLLLILGAHSIDAPRPIGPDDGLLQTRPAADVDAWLGGLADRHRGLRWSRWSACSLLLPVPKHPGAVAAGARAPTVGRRSHRRGDLVAAARVAGHGPAPLLAHLRALAHLRSFPTWIVALIMLLMVLFLVAAPRPRSCRSSLSAARRPGHRPPPSGSLLNGPGSRPSCSAWHAPPRLRRAKHQGTLPQQGEPASHDNQGGHEMDS